MTQTTQNPYDYAPTDNSVYLKIEPNTSERIRIISDPIRFMTKFPGSDQMKERFAWLVIHKKATAEGPVRSIRAYECGVSVWSSIRNLTKHEDYGIPTGYDITISREGSGATDTKYNIVASPPKPLTPEDEKLVSENTLSLPELYKDKLNPPVASYQHAGGPSQDPGNPPEEFDPFEGE